MKSKAIYHLIIMTMSFISLSGCGTFEKSLGIAQFQPMRSVENNVFSSSFPELRLQISQDLRYLGSVQLFESTGTRISGNIDVNENIDVTSYLFGQMDQGNRIARGVIIRMLVMHGDPSAAVPEMFARTIKNSLASGEMKILEETYQYDLYAGQELFMLKEKGLLGNSRTPSCFLIKELSNKTGFGNKSRVRMLYFEDASNTCANRACGTCLDSKNRTEEQKQIIQGFIDRSYASTRFLKMRSVEDTTSRYVDAEPKMQPAPAKQIQPQSTPVERAQPAPAERLRPAPEVVPVAPREKAPPVAESKADPLEKRLETLKRIYEKNLISKEDYEKKKAEILKEL